MGDSYSVASSNLPSFFMISTHCFRTDAVALVITIVGVFDVLLVGFSRFTCGNSELLIDEVELTEALLRFPVNFRFLLIGVAILEGEDVEICIGLILSDFVSILLVLTLASGAWPMENRALICSFMVSLGACIGMIFVFDFSRLSVWRLAMDSTEIGSDNLGGNSSCSASNSASSICRFRDSLSSPRLLKSRAVQLLVAIVFLRKEDASSFCELSLDDDTNRICQKRSSRCEDQ
jgi:hypothetical protein